MKFFIVLITVVFSINIYASDCPDLQGRYPKCKSEIRDIRGEYIIEQYLKDDVMFYQIHYIDDETNENRTDAFRTDGKLESRKERLPRVGIKVRIDARSKCVDGTIVSDAHVYFLKKHVGAFKTKIYTENGTLYSNLDGKYLGKPLSKRIVCTQE